MAQKEFEMQQLQSVSLIFTIVSAWTCNDHYDIFCHPQILDVILIYLLID